MKSMKLVSVSRASSFSCLSRSLVAVCSMARVCLSGVPPVLCAIGSHCLFALLEKHECVQSCMVIDYASAGRRVGWEGSTASIIMIIASAV